LSQPPAPPPSGIPARIAALKVLDRILIQGSSLDEALDEERSLLPLSPRDRGFARLLVTTILRRLRQIDLILNNFLADPDRLKPSARAILRLGAAQMLFLDGPAHAAVNSCVTLAEKTDHVAFKGMINAVLRRVSENGPKILATQNGGRISTPDWLWKSWVAAYGPNLADKIANANLTEAPLDLTAKSDPVALSERLKGRLLPNQSIRLYGSGLIPEIDGFEDGSWWVQDAAAALPALLLGDVRGKTVLDLCAAPGGKTAQIAAMGGVVTAVDLSEKRLIRLRENMKRLNLSSTVITSDIASYTPATLADAVLLDAPCSATGTIRRHPDILYSKHAIEIQAKTKLQDRLLAQAATMIKSGGVLVYCTCSLQPEEGEQRIQAFLSKNPSFTRRPITAGESGIPADWITPDGDLRTLPCHLPDLGGMDGFYAARLCRN
jgi:16S rRNA (cytosine967-C5)-methyltransferase